MPRKQHHSTPIIIGRLLYTHSAAVPLDTAASFTWLELHSTFYFDSPLGSFTAGCEQPADALFCYALSASTSGSTKPSWPGLPLSALRALSALPSTWLVAAGA
jgi:hypothetical protein